MATETDDQTKTGEPQSPERHQLVETTTGDAHEIPQSQDKPETRPGEDAADSSSGGLWNKIRAIAENLKSLQTIAIVIAFFVGGAVFALNYFVQRAVFNSELQKIYKTQTAEITKLQCQMVYNDAKIAAEQNRYRKEVVQKANWAIVAEVKTKQQNGVATENDILDLQEAESTLESLAENYRNSEEALREAEVKLNALDCQ